MDLFIPEPTLEFEQPKVAATRLDEDPSMWPKQILQELFRQLPESAEYVPRVMMTEVNDEQGYGYGAVIITSATDSAMTVSEGSGQATKRVLVPILVKQNMLQPLDLLMVGRKMLPLTGSRLRQALFRPSTFSMITQDWGDQSLYDMFYPPGRSDNDVGSGTGGGSGVIRGPGAKFSSVQSILDVVGCTISKPDLEDLAEKLAADPGLGRQLAKNEAFRNSIAKLAQFEDAAYTTADGLFQKIAESRPVHVAQFGFDGTQYWVKKASRDFYFRQAPEYLTRRELLKLAGEEVATKVDMDGTVTVAEPTQDNAPMELEASQWEVVSRSGIYKVKSEGGKEMMGWVIPDLLGFDGVRLPLAVFTNGVIAVVQDAIAGSHISEGINLPDDEPGGTGLFYVAVPGGGVVATVPVSVEAASDNMDGSTSYHAKTMLGDEIEVKLVDGLKSMVPGDVVAMLPGTAKFMKLDQELQIPLVSSPEGVTKTAADVAEASVRVWSDGLRWGTRYNNLPKLAAHFPTEHDRDSVVFTLCVAGLNAAEANKVASRAAAGATQTCQAVQDIRPSRDLMIPSMEKGAEMAAMTRSLRRDLVKEASMLPDVQTIDTILSLGFINPENVRVYLGYLPYLEQALSQVCELTLGARLGLTEIPEFAAARATRSLNEVCEGLNALALREVDEAA